MEEKWAGKNVRWPLLETLLEPMPSLFVCTRRLHRRDFIIHACTSGGPHFFRVPRNFDKPMDNGFSVEGGGFSICDFDDDRIR